MIDVRGQAEVVETEQGPAIQARLRFYVETEAHSVVDWCRVSKIRVGAKAIAFKNKCGLRSPSGDSLDFPVRLRPDDNDTVNRVDLLIWLEEPLPEGRLKADLEFGFVEVISISLRLTGNVAGSEISQLRIGRTRRFRLPSVNLVWILALLVGTSTWNYFIYSRVSLPDDRLFSSSDLTALLAFLVGFLGFPSLSLLAKWVSSLERVRNIFHYPELFLGTHLVGAFRSPLLTLALLLATAFVVFSWTAYASSELENPDPSRMGWYTDDGRLVNPDGQGEARALRSGAASLSLYCSREREIDPRSKVRLARVADPQPDELITMVVREFGAFEIAWEEVSVAYTGNIPGLSGCDEERQHGGEIQADVVLSASLKDPCLRPIEGFIEEAVCNDKLNATLPHGVHAERNGNRFSVGWSGIYDYSAFRDRMLVLSRRLDEYGRTSELRRSAGAVVDRFLAESGTTKRVPFSLVPRYMREQSRDLAGSNWQSLRSLVLIRAALGLYTMAPSGGPKTVDLDEMFAELEPIHRGTRAVNKSVLAALVRLLLTLEARFEGEEIAASLTESTLDRFQDTGYEYYWLLLEETLAVQYGENKRISTKYEDFLVEAFSGVAVEKPGHAENAARLLERYPGASRFLRLIQEAGTSDVGLTGRSDPAT